MADSGPAFLTVSRDEFARLRATAERALDQLEDRQFFAVPNTDSNSVAVLVKHLAGNLHSRWTDFLTSDGEKPERARDAEFEIHAADTRPALMAAWASGWGRLFNAIDALTADELLRTVTVRAEPMSVIAAMQRQLVHTAGHVGQIIQLAKQHRGGDWRTLTIARGASAAYTTAARRRAGAPDHPDRQCRQRRGRAKGDDEDAARQG